MKNIVKIILITIFVILLIICIFINDKTKKEKEAREVIPLVEEYLNDKYNEEFNISVNSIGNKEEEYYMKGTYHRHIIGKYDKNVKQYVFAVNPKKEENIHFYITVWLDDITGNSEIKEVNGSKSNRTDTSYERIKKIYDQKIEIKDKLIKILEDNYSDYEIEFNFKEENYFNQYRILINFKHSMIEELNNDLNNIEAMKNLLNNKDIGIQIKFNDYLFTYSYNDEYPESKTIENEIKYFRFVKQVYNFLETNLGDKYSVEQSYHLTIDINAIYNENDGKYKNTIEGLNKIIDENKVIRSGGGYQTITLKFKNRDIRLYGK